MSLFRVKQLWEPEEPPRGEVFFHDSMALVHSPLSADPLSPLVVVGSASGMLRVYAPSGILGQGDGAWGGCACEHDLGVPVLRVHSGRLVTGASAGDEAVAVLTPRRLVVMAVRRSGQVGAGAGGMDGGITGAADAELGPGNSMGGAAEGLSLVRVYDHALERSAFNMCVGPFGGAASQDAICVQSMDGVLSFFDREVRSFSCFLPNFTAPGPFCYAPRSDCFVTVGSDMVAVCYKYHSIASHAEHSERERIREAAEADAPPSANSNPVSLGSSGDAAAGGGGNGGGDDNGGGGVPRSRSTTGISGSGPLRCEWRRILGEHAVEIEAARFKQDAPGGQGDIVVVGELTLFALHEATGAVRYQRRLDRTPICARAFPVEARGGSHNLLVASKDAVLDVLSNGRLVWGAGLPFEPVRIEVATVRSHPGCLVMLSPTGELVIGYLGTDPTAGGPAASAASARSKLAIHAHARSPSAAGKKGGKGAPAAGEAAVADLRDLDYAKADAEQRELQKRIKEHKVTGRRKVDPAQLISIFAQAPNAVDPPSPAEPGTRSVTSRVVVSYSGAQPLRNVLLSLAVPPPYRVENNSLTIEELVGGSTPLALPVTVSLDAIDGRDVPNIIPSNTTVGIVASYTSLDGDVRTCTGELILPLCLSVKPCEASRNPSDAAVRLTLDTGLPSAFPLSEVFPDLLLAQGEASPPAIGLCHHTTGHIVTVVEGKKGGGRYRVQAPSVPDAWIVYAELSRRIVVLSGGKARPMSPDPVPSLDALIDAHHHHRQRLRDIMSELSRVSRLAVHVQKRLLVRFMDRNAPPLSGMDLLMERTLSTCATLGASAEREQSLVSSAASALACGLGLACSVAARGKESEEYLLLSALAAQALAGPPGSVSESIGGWEEQAEAGLAHLLRTALARSAADAATVPAPVGFPEDPERVKKMARKVLERVAKGAELSTAVK